MRTPALQRAEFGEQSGVPMFASRRVSLLRRRLSAPQEKRLVVVEKQKTRIRLQKT